MENENISETRISRRNNQPKRHRLRKVIIVLVSVLLVLALIFSGIVLLERQTVSKKTNAIIAKIVPSASNLAAAASSAKSATPDAIASELNKNAASIVSESQGLVDSATAASTDSSVTYTLVSSKVNSLMANLLFTTNGDQFQQIANQVMDSMQQAGVAHPKVTIRLVDPSGNLIKSQTYSR